MLAEAPLMNRSSDPQMQQGLLQIGIFRGLSVTPRAYPMIRVLLADDATQRERTCAAGTRTVRLNALRGRPCGCVAAFVDVQRPIIAGGR